MIAPLRYRRHQRLLTREDFERTYTLADRSYKTAVCAATACRNQLEAARLGLIVGKKSLPMAVSRNRFKRIAREVFRCRQQELCGLDVIIMARARANNMPPRELRASIEQLFTGLATCASS